MNNLQKNPAENNPTFPSQLDLFSCQGKKVEVSFHDDHISSDGGVLLLREVEQETGLLQDIASVLKDERDQRYVEHSVETMLRQRVFQIACGYEDANDCNSLKSDPIFKMSADRLPESGSDLASQPTMTRFENAVGNGELYRIAEVFVRHFINSYGEEPPLIVLDCDDTNNNTHGDQQLTLFNHYYGEYCYMPLHIYEGLSGKLITCLLKPGRRSKSANVFSVLNRLIGFIRSYWKKTLIVVRGDSHFASRELMDWAEEQEKLHFITGLASNVKLKTRVAGKLKTAKELFERKKKKITLYHSFEYKAESWGCSQRVVAKIEYSHQGENVRFIVTDLRPYRTKTLYKLGYCGRGKMELFIKNHKRYLRSDRSSCNRFQANQFRLFLHSAAYVLLHTLQNEVLRGTQYAKSTMETLKLKLMKVAARVREIKTRIKIELPKSAPAIPAIVRSFQLFSVLRC